MFCVSFIIFFLKKQISATVYHHNVALKKVFGDDPDRLTKKKLFQIIFFCQTHRATNNNNNESNNQCLRVETTDENYVKKNNMTISVLKWNGCSRFSFVVVFWILLMVHQVIIIGPLGLVVERVP